MEENKELNNQEEKIFKDVKENVQGDGLGKYNPGQYYFPDPVVSSEETIKNINVARETFYTYINQSNKIKKIMLFSFLGIFLLLGILLIAKPELVNQLFTPLIVVFLIFLLASFGVVSSTKKKRNFHFDQYRYHYFIAIDSYCYYQTGYSNIELSYNSKIELDEIKKIGCYENVVSAPTRDIVKGTVFGVNFFSCDALIKSEDKIDGKKVINTIFSGKLFKLDLKSKKPGKMYLYLNGCGDAHPTELKGMEPTQIKDLKKEYEVFTSFENPNTMLNKKCVESLNKLTIDDIVEDVILSISKEGVYLGISLTSEYMTIPYQNEVNDKFLKYYKKIVELVSIFVTGMLSNENYQINSNIEEN